VPKLSFVIGHALVQKRHSPQAPIAAAPALEIWGAGRPAASPPPPARRRGFPRFSDRFLPAKTENHYNDENEQEATHAEGKVMNAPSEMNFEDMLRIRLEVLRREHRDLDEAIHALETSGRPDQLTLRRLKKQKLALKDQIVKLEDQLIPDIIA
jgi:hypothetical protein